MHGPERVSGGGDRPSACMEKLSAMDSTPIQTTAAPAVEEDVKKKSRRGGSRPGAGRPRISDEALDVKVHLRLSAQQRDLLQRLGGISWLRGLLDDIEKKLASDAKLAPSDVPVEVDGLIAKERTALMMHAVGEGDDAAPAEKTQVSALQSAGSFDLRPYLYGPNARFDAVYKSRVFAVRITSDSMIDAGLSMGDIVLVDPAQTPKSSELACVSLNGTMLVRRYVLLPSDERLDMAASVQALPRAPKHSIAAEGEESSAEYVPSVESLQAESAAPSSPGTIFEARPDGADGPDGAVVALEAANAALGIRTIYPKPWMSFEVIGRVTSVIKPMTTDRIERRAAEKPAP